MTGFGLEVTGYLPGYAQDSAERAGR